MSVRTRAGDGFTCPLKTCASSTTPRRTFFFSYVIDERWAALMEFEIARTEAIYREAEKGIPALIPDARWPVWASLIFYRRILTKVRANGYQNFLQRAYVPRAEKFLLLPIAWAKAQPFYASKAD